RGTRAAGRQGRAGRPGSSSAFPSWGGNFEEVLCLQLVDRSAIGLEDVLVRVDERDDADAIEGGKRPGPGHVIEAAERREPLDPVEAAEPLEEPLPPRVQTILVPLVAKGVRAARRAEEVRGSQISVDRLIDLAGPGTDPAHPVSRRGAVEP